MLPIGTVAPDMVARGRLITLEGVDGAGKTTLAGALHEALLARGLDVVLLREPGGVEASERIRTLVKDPALAIGARAEALLYAAARAQLVQEAIVPAVNAGTWLLLDRFVDSSLAYQGAGRGLGIEAVAEINRFATGGLAPDRTLLLAMAPEAALARSRERGEPVDRLERESESFFARIAGAYAGLAREEPGRFRVLDASREPARVLEDALAALADLLPGGRV